MEDKPFIWTTELCKTLLRLRFENDWLFKKKQPWKEFFKILQDSGEFPEAMNIDHVRKKWSYMYDTYKIAKKTKNKEWKYYKIFDKHYGKSKVLDKYDSWNDEWRLKLITCVTETKLMKLNYEDMWRTVESALRCQDLPDNCCIQDIKGLWHHIRMTFNRKHRIALRRGGSDWPLYDSMMDYYKACDPTFIVNFDSCSGEYETRQRKASVNYLKKYQYQDGDEEFDFQWTKDITESFIQIRLQNDWLFRERKWAWNDLCTIMIEEHGFPKLLTGREISKKWAATYSEYQKAKATNNKSWVYYTLFELYLGEGSLSLNPIVGWQEEWVSNLISARIDLEHLFTQPTRDNNVEGWREVEKRLRSIGLPIDHSLLQLPEIWLHLVKTYRWKKKFAKKGILTEHWPYFEAMAQYEEIQNRSPVIKQQKQEVEHDYDCNDDDYEDDIKLFDLKQKLELQVKLETNQCRSCSNAEACVNIFDQVDGDGLNLAAKLKIIAGVQVLPSDTLPSQICLHCLQELDSAYKFRQKCQQVDKQYRSTISENSKKVIKIELPDDEKGPETDNNKDNLNRINNEDDLDRMDVEDTHFDDIHTDTETRPKKHRDRRLPPKKKRRIRKDKYVYWKICDICGKHTRNLVSHLDSHSTGKSYSCDVCDKKFKFKSGLVIHKAVHDPTPRKVCGVCGKTFHIMAQYRRHFVYHANERKYECETCGKRFNTVDILKVHNRTHTDERPFPCPECGKTFRTAGCVSRHKRIVHKIKSQ